MRAPSLSYCSLTAPFGFDESTMPSPSKSRPVPCSRCTDSSRECHSECGPALERTRRTEPAALSMDDALHPSGTAVFLQRSKLEPIMGEMALRCPEIRNSCKWSSPRISSSLGMK